MKEICLEMNGGYVLSHGNNWNQIDKMFAVFVRKKVVLINHYPGLKQVCDCLRPNIFHLWAGESCSELSRRVCNSIPTVYVAKGTIGKEEYPRR